MYVLAVVSADGCKICLPESVITRVYAADCKFCGMFLKPTEFVPSTVQFDRVPLVGVPRLGVVNVGLVLKTVDPDPVDDVTPVPPLATGKAVPL